LLEGLLDAVENSLTMQAVAELQQVENFPACSSLRPIWTIPVFPLKSAGDLASLNRQRSL
jgi:hypothetical protein